MKKISSEISSFVAPITKEITKDIMKDMNSDSSWINENMINKIKNNKELLRKLKGE